jgi:hypothetical protein
MNSFNCLYSGTLIHCKSEGFQSKPHPLILLFSEMDLQLCAILLKEKSGRYLQTGKEVRVERVTYFSCLNSVSSCCMKTEWKIMIWHLIYWKL